jgi:2-oxoisovalerate dehydrogenase E1 component beta subunit
MTGRSVTEQSVVEAVRGTLHGLMEEDERVVVLGLDVGKLGGVFRATDGLLDRFGPERVIDTPMMELSVVGTAIGMALRGLRPIAEIQFGDFVWAAADQLFNEAAKIRYRSAGEWHVPLVVRATWGAGIHGALYHSQSIEAPLCHYPGLKVVAPATPADAAALLRAAVEDPDPVVFLEHKLLYRQARGAVPDPVAPVPLGTAAVVRPGRDVSVLAYGWMLHQALLAADRLADGGPDVEVVDVRSLLPLDRDTLAASASRTGRVLVVHEAARTMGLGAEISAVVHEACFGDLVAPVERLTMPDVAGTPFAAGHEALLIPGVDDIADALVRLAARTRPPRATATAVPDGAAPDAGAPDTPTYRDASAPQASMTMPVELGGDEGEDLVARLVHATARTVTEQPDAHRRWRDDGGLDEPEAVVVAVVEDDGAGGSRELVVAGADRLSCRGVAEALAEARAAGADGGAPEPTITVVVAGPGAAFGIPRVRAGQTTCLQAGAPALEVVADGDGVAVRRRLWLTISADHRVLDGAASARFLDAVRAGLLAAT